jgi:hypothetical protein
MVKADLDGDGKPVFTGITGGAIHVASAATFAQWYRNTAGVNDPTASKLPLYNNGKDAYVNRYGANGEQWYSTETAYYCGNVGAELLDASGNPIPCTSKYAGSTNCTDKEALGEEMLKCYISNGNYSATYIVARWTATRCSSRSTTTISPRPASARLRNSTALRPDGDLALRPGRKRQQALAQLQLHQ